MKKVKFIAIGLAVLLIAVFFIGFYNNWFFINRYNATLHSNARGYLQDEFVFDNTISGVYYLNPDYIEGVTREEFKYYEYDGRPRERIFVITNQEQFDDIITGWNTPVDFEKEMFIVRIFGCSEHRLPYYLKDISINDDGMLTIKYSMKYSDSNGGLLPSVRFFLIKLNKLDVKEVKFKELRPTLINL